MPSVASYLRVDADLTGDPLSLTPTWTDYTQHFQSCRISRGRAGVFDLYKVGTLQLTARNGRKGTDTPWLDPNVWYRWRQIRVVYTGGVTDIPLFTGYITKTDHSLNQPTNVNIVTISAVDKLGIIREEALDFSGTADSDPFLVWAANGLDVGTADTFVDGYSENFAGEAIDLYGGSNAPVFFPAQEIEDPLPEGASKRTKRIRRKQVKGNFWQLLQDALEVEYGAMHVDAAGGFAFNGRYSALLALGEPTGLVITDTPGVQVDFPFPEYQAEVGTVQMAPPGSDYMDAAVATGTTGNQQKTTVTPAGFPETTYARTSLPCPNDNWVKANCDLWARLFSQTATWMSRATIVLNPRADAGPLVEGTVALGRLGIYQFHTPVGAAQMFTIGLVDGIDHEIFADPPLWKATLSMTDLMRWFTAYGTFDDYGILGSTWTLGTSKVAP